MRTGRERLVRSSPFLMRQGGAAQTALPQRQGAESLESDTLHEKS